MSGARKYEVIGGKTNLGDPSFWNAIFRDIDARIKGLEAVKASVQTASDELIEIGLRRINDVLIPAYQEISDLAHVGIFFIAHSSTELPVTTGNVILVVDEADRATFAAPLHVAISASGAETPVLYGQVSAWDPDNGELTVAVSIAVGAGTHDDWTVSISAPPDVTQSAFRLAGDWDPSIGSFPAAALKGNVYMVIADGTVDGIEFKDGDRLLAKIDDPSTATFAGNWSHSDFTDKVSSVGGNVGHVTDSQLAQSVENDGRFMLAAAITLALADKADDAMVSAALTALSAAIDDKADAAATAAALAGKAALAHTHSAADITSGLLALARGGLGADLSALNGTLRVSAGAAAALATVSQAEAEAGTANTVREWTAQRVAQAVAALSPKIWTKLGTYAADGSSANLDITGIPAGVNEIRMVGRALRGSANGFPTARLGTSGGLITSGYAARSASTGANNNATAHFLLANDTTTSLPDLAFDFAFAREPGTHDWYILGMSEQFIGIYPTVYFLTGIVPLGAELTQMRVTVSAGVIDSGEIDVFYRS